ncbi:cryptochrome DASH-like [Clytia hemisphaerica]|uniref:Cryptochrome DASH n=1 Tax=Clytia hemisphaerica TaxID=252671 RepID=A0A7M5X436_9CNID
MSFTRSKSSIAMSMKRSVIYLFQNDLRLHDNECLKIAQSKGNFLIPLYCFQPNHFKGTYSFNLPRSGTHRTKFLIESITDLRANLQKLGSNLVVRNESPLSTIKDLVKLCQNSEAPVSSIIYQKEVTSEEIDLEKQIKSFCKEQSIEDYPVWGLSLFHKDDIPYNKKTIPDTYSKFRQGVESKSEIRDLIPTPLTLNKLPPIKGASLGDIPTMEKLIGVQSYMQDNRTAVPLEGGESAGLKHLQKYLWDTDAISTYKETRNGLLGEEYSTKFSIWLANGSLSPRQIYHEVKRYENQRVSNQSTYWSIFELIWRDYFKFVCWKYGRKVFYLSGIMGKHLPWKQDKIAFQKWCQGETGVPFVDANMRELLHTGWMSNRGRQNVASFLVKDLKLDWRLGAEWFESQLLDHDVCSNYGNWNYSAGIGNDPRQDRKFNMIKQALDYDAEGKFVKTWVPELTNLPANKIHVPWTIPDRELQRLEFSLGQDYPKPMVMAPEWGRHTHKTNGKAFQKNAEKPQRGIDFYFKSPDAGPSGQGSAGGKKNQRR